MPFEKLACPRYSEAGRPDRHVEVARDGAPRGAVILVGEFTAVRVHVLRRDRPRALPARAGARQARKAVTAVGVVLDVHLPVRHLDGIEHDAAVEQRAPRHRHADALRGEERARLGREALDDQVLEHEAAAPEMNAHAADVHRPAHEPRRFLLRARLQRRAEVHRQRRDERHREDHGARDHDAAHDAARGPSDRMGEELFHETLTRVIPAALHVIRFMERGPLRSARRAGTAFA